MSVVAVDAVDEVDTEAIDQELASEASGSSKNYESVVVVTLQRFTTVHLAD